MPKGRAGRRGQPKKLFAPVEKLGPLHGVPISIKSAIDVAGLRCESGSRLRAGIVAARDAPLVTRLRQAARLFMGVTNTPELLMAW